MTSILNIKYLDIFNIFLKGKKREKLDYILEPLQAMIQLSFLAFVPIGSKLSINHNILAIQQPSIVQGVIRYFNDDTKDDLYYLFNVIKRFFSYYKFLADSEHCPLYLLLIEFAKQGLERLINTYTSSNKNSVVHTLKVYRLILDSPELLNNSDSFDIINIEDRNSIDNIFINITKIYTIEEFNIVYNLLLLLKTRDDIELLDGLNTILQPTHCKIEKWINDNIAL